MLNGSIADGIKVKIDKVTGRLATNLTPESQIEEKTFRQVHSILYYINKDDPQGTTPPDLDNEQFRRWEEAVKTWAEKNGFTSEDPPTEVDDVHTLSNQPKINFTSPNNNQTITSRDLKASVDTTAPRGVSRVEYYLNNRLLKTVSAAPFGLEVFLDDPNIQTGFYTLKAVAYDDVDNNQNAEIELNLQLPALPSALEWSAPSANTTLKSSQFPYTIKATLGNSSGIQKIDVYYQSAGQANYINTARQFPGGQLDLQWLSPPPPGSYQLYADITNQDGFSYKSSEISITIK